MIKFKVVGFTSLPPSDVPMVTIELIPKPAYGLQQTSLPLSFFQDSYPAIGQVYELNIKEFS
jgi:hypothetical protein